MQKKFWKVLVLKETIGPKIGLQNPNCFELSYKGVERI